MNEARLAFFNFFSRFKGNSDLGFIFGLFGAVFLLVVPIHKDFLSVLLVLSIAVSLFNTAHCYLCKRASRILGFSYDSLVCNFVQAWFECSVDPTNSLGCRCWFSY